MLLISLINSAGSCIAALVQKCKHFFNNHAALQKLKHEYTAISPGTRPLSVAAMYLQHITAGSLCVSRGAPWSGRCLPAQDGPDPGSTLVPISPALARCPMQLPCLKKVPTGGKVELPQFVGQPPPALLGAAGARSVFSTACYSRSRRRATSSSRMESIVSSSSASAPRKAASFFRAPAIV